MRLPQILALILLMSLASFAQSNPTTFTNTAAGFHSGDFVSTIDTEDSQPVGTCSGGSGCFIDFQFSGPNDLGIWLPDIGLACALSTTSVHPPGFCYTTGCQTVTYTAVANTTPPEDDGCADLSGQVWTVTTTQSRHWDRNGTYISGPVWDGGNGTISAVVGKKHKKH